MGNTPPISTQDRFSGVKMAFIEVLVAWVALLGTYGQCFSNPSPQHGTVPRSTTLAEQHVWKTIAFDRQACKAGSIAVAFGRMATPSIETPRLPI